MQIFIDSAEVDKIKQAWDWGIIDGVTTNPIQHPLTDIGIDIFLKDWAKVPK